MSSNSATKKKILVFIDWFEPGYKAGGPIRSVASLIQLLSDHYNFTVVTSNKDLNETQPYDSVKSDIWIKKNNYKVIYLSKGSFLVFYNIIKSESPDIIYFNSFFSLKYTLIPLVLSKIFRNGNKLILAPRGMLQKGALSIKSYQKRIFIQVSKICRIYTNIRWQATDSQEVKDIEDVYSKEAEIMLARNIPILINQPILYITKTKSCLKLVTISLISPKKNINKVLETLMNEIGNIEYDIYGPIKDANYWSQCLDTINKLPSNIKVNYKGDLKNDKVYSTLQEYHFFILPTLGENFGHAIYEAFNAGRPVIISTLTPWKNLQEYGAGWDIDLHNENELANVLRKVYSMGQKEYDTYCKNARAVAMKYVEESNFISQYQQLFD